MMPSAEPPAWNYSFFTCLPQTPTSWHFSGFTMDLPIPSHLNQSQLLPRASGPCIIWLCSLRVSPPTSPAPAPALLVSVLCLKHSQDISPHTAFARGVPSAWNTLPPGLHRAVSTSLFGSLSNVISSESSLMTPFAIPYPTIPDPSMAHHSLPPNTMFICFMALNLFQN